MFGFFFSLLPPELLVPRLLPARHFQGEDASVTCLGLTFSGNSSRTRTVDRLWTYAARGLRGATMIFHECLILIFFAWPERAEELQLEDRVIRIWPFDARLFMRHRAFLRQNVLRPRYVGNEQWDMAVYVRLDDITSNWYEGYTLPPLSYYDLALRHARLNETSRIVVFGHCTSLEQWEMLRGVEAVVRHVTKSINVRVSGNETIDEAYRIMLRSRTLIGQTSTFWLVPSVASRFLREIHVPCFGEILKFGFFNDVDGRDVVLERPKYRRIDMWTDDGTFTVYCYDLGRNLRSSGRDELDRFWDFLVSPEPHT